MTIEFINDWQGFKAGQTRTLTSAQETAAIAAGAARSASTTPSPRAVGRGLGSFIDAASLAVAHPPGAAFDGCTASVGIPSVEYYCNGVSWDPLGAVSGAGNSALAVVNAAVRARETAAVKIVGIGDSWMEYRTVTAFGKQWTQLIQALLRGKYPTSGIGAKGGIGYVPIQNVSIFAPYTNPWVKAGTVGTNFTLGGLGLRYATFTASGDKATITVNGTSCNLHYLKGTSSRVGYYKVDGGAAVTFETNNGVQSDDGFLAIPLGASGSHTLEVGWSSGGVVYIAGAIFFDGDESKGFHFYEGGHTAYRTSDYVTGAPGADALHTRIAAINPHLTILAVNQNDFARENPNFLTPAQCKANTKSIIASLRAKGVTSSFLLVLSADVSAGKAAEQTATWPQFQAAIKEVAFEDTGGVSGASGVAVVSITDSSLIPPSTGSAGGLWIDAQHVGDVGHIPAANVIALPI